MSLLLYGNPELFKSNALVMKWTDMIKLHGKESIQTIPSQTMVSPHFYIDMPQELWVAGLCETL